MNAIPLQINPLFWLLASLIGWLSSGTLVGTAIWIVVILVSVLVHEFGHALTAKAFGQHARIELTAMGGITHRYGGKLKGWQEFLVVLDGPLAGFTLFIIARLVDPLTSGMVAKYTLMVFQYVNLVWTVINLFPIYPLDGGHLLSIILQGIFGIKGLKIALFFSMVVAGTLSFAFFASQLFLGGALLLMLAFEGYRAWQGTLNVTEEDRDDTLQELLKKAEELMHAGNNDEAEKVLKGILSHVKESGVVKLTATQYLAAIYCNEGRYQQAYTLLQPFEKKLAKESLLMLHQLSFKTGHWDEAIKVGNECYQNYPHYDTALINAYCHAIKGEARPAIGWLQCAIREGLPNINAILRHREFDAIRSDPAWNKMSKMERQDG